VAGKRAGRSGSKWRALRENQKAKKLPCFHDGQPIDYDAKWPDPNSFSVDHLKSWRDHPDLREDPANLVSAHLRCNQSKGAGDIKPGLGNRSEDW
jgi:5-methylcytosine-specific restriction endonuclease McrA